MFNKLAKEFFTFPSFSCPASIFSKFGIKGCGIFTKCGSKFSLCAYMFLFWVFLTLKDCIVETKIQVLFFISCGLIFAKSSISKIATLPLKAKSNISLFGCLGFFNVFKVCSFIVVVGVNHILP